MSTIVRYLASFRLAVLLFLLPPAWLWAGTEGSGGAALVLALASLAFAHLAIFDTKTMSAGKRVRLSFTRDPRASDRGITSVWGAYATGAYVLFTLILLIVSLRSGVMMALLGLFVLPFTGGVGVGGRFGRDRRLFLSELINPIVLLVLPTIVVGSRTVLNEGAAEAVNVEIHPLLTPITCISALMLCAYMLACMIRDEGEDRSDSQLTTPTILGRRGGLMMLFLALVGVQLIAVLWTGVEQGFSWGTAATACVGGMVILWDAAEDADDGAPQLVLLTQALLIASYTMA